MCLNQFWPLVKTWYVSLRRQKKTDGSIVEGHIFVMLFDSLSRDLTHDIEKMNLINIQNRKISVIDIEKKTIRMNYLGCILDVIA